MSGWQPGPRCDQEIFLLRVVDLVDRTGVAVVRLDQDSIIHLENPEPDVVLDGRDGGDGPVLLHHVQKYFPRVVRCDAADSPQSWSRLNLRYLALLMRLRPVSRGRLSFMMVDLRFPIFWLRPLPR